MIRVDKARIPGPMIGDDSDGRTCRDKSTFLPKGLTSVTIIVRDLPDRLGGVPVRDVTASPLQNWSYHRHRNAAWSAKSFQAFSGRLRKVPLCLISLGETLPRPCKLPCGRPPYSQFSLSRYVSIYLIRLLLHCGSLGWMLLQHPAPPWTRLQRQEAAPARG